MRILVLCLVVLAAMLAALSPPSGEARNPECFTSGDTGQHIVCAHLDHTAGALETGTFSAVAPTFADLTELGGIGTSAVSCVSWGERHDCFVKATDDTLYSIAYLGGRRHSAWAGLGAPRGGLRGDPSCVSWAPGRIDCLASGADGALWHKAWDGARWLEWRSVAPQIQGSPRCFTRMTGRIDCMVRAVGGRMTHVHWDGAAWRVRDAPVSTGVRAMPDCASFLPPSLSCVFNVDGFLVHKSWDGARWTDRTHPNRHAVPFDGEFDCVSGGGGQSLLCAVRTVFIGAPAIGAAVFRAGDSTWSNWHLLTLLDAHEISCAATAEAPRRPSRYVCAYTARGGGGPLGYTHWNGARTSTGSIIDELSGEIPGTAVGLDYARFRGR